MTVVGRAAEPAGATLRDGAGLVSRVSDVLPKAAHGLHPVCVGREVSWGLVF